MPEPREVVRHRLTYSCDPYSTPGGALRFWQSGKEMQSIEFGAIAEIDSMIHALANLRKEIVNKGDAP